jgi:hypothetical protein
MHLKYPVRVVQPQGNDLKNAEVGESLFQIDQSLITFKQTLISRAK